MKFPVPTSEQYQRFQQEFADYWNSFGADDPNDIEDRTEQEELWCRARAYSAQLSRKEIER